ncbi:hypothetical protein BHU72_04485 [Desulfuribacillus stibiiarsenatis]|uniref:DUF218 domain-containing protein n=1 Tax=Desulfuribacillus stibiiarsenatis TaxID=1390249 RepID=A0A1E5L5W5_9FIRM|nr:hypothetical protein BHU72_04485 [Desulfuribacillus stibiiarsenatis]
MITGIIVLILGALIISFIFIQFKIHSEKNVSEDIEVKYLLILGAGLRGDEPSLSLWYRLNEGLEYLKQYPNTKVVVSGGLGPGEQYTEAEVMKQFLVDRGITEDRIIKEERATNTKENIQYTREILLQLEQQRNTVNSTFDIGTNPIQLMIITNDYHLYRSKKLAERFGFEAYGIPAKTPAVVAFKYFIREYFAVVKSFVFDR